MAAISLLVAVNDLEAKTIAELATARGCHVPPLTLDWGERLDPATIAAGDLAETVILVELPHPEFEARLRALGKTVHVVDHHLTIAPNGESLDRRHPWSSLEQVAALLQVKTLTPRQRQISANDRDFIPGLAAALTDRDTGALDHKTLHDLRLEELNLRLAGQGQARLDAALAWVRGAQQAGRLAVLETGRDVADDPCLILVRAPVEHAACLTDALYRWRHEQDPKRHPLTQPLEVLALFAEADDPARPSTGLLFSGRAERLDLIRQVLEEPDGPRARLTRWAGGGGVGSFFGARDDWGSEDPAVDELADRLLDELLTGNRPLVSWRSHFLQTVTLKTAVEPGQVKAPWQPEVLSTEHRRYFLAHLRDLLTPAADAPGYRPGPGPEPRDLYLRSYVWTDPGLGLAVTIPAGAGFKLQAVVPVRTIRVHLLLDDLAIVEWECRGGLCNHDGTDGMPIFREPSGRTWRRMLALDSFACRARPEDRALSTVAQVLDFNWAVRFCSSPYLNPRDSARVALLNPAGAVLGELTLGAGVDTTEIAGAFAALLTHISESGLPIAPDGLVFDERARVVSGLVATGNPPRSAAGRDLARVILARLATVDSYGTGHCYDRDFATAELERSSYDRFAGFGSRYAITDQSFILFAHGDFAAELILRHHLPVLYHRMVLIALFYSAALNRFAHEVGRLSRQQDLEPAGEKIRTLRKRFVRFANGLWFETVTSQLQGRDLFERIRKALPIAADYAELKVEIERTDDMLDAIQQAENQHLTRRWQIIGGGGLVLAVTSGLLGMHVFTMKHPAVTGWNPYGLFAFVLAAGVALLLIAWATASGWPRRLSGLRRCLRPGGRGSGPP
jgi:hypothetical protein